MIPVFDGDQLRFWLSQHLVTNGQFDTFLQAEENAGWQPMVKQYDQGYRRYWRDDGIDPDLEHHPVVNVSVKGACAYARWVGQQIGRPLRLPRVSEWERAAIAGRPDRWLDDEMAEGRVNYSRTLGKPARVGDFGVNPYGISDLIGNVFDLCLDDGGSPVLCGGTFRSTRERLGEHLPMDSLTRRRPDVGFRCAYDEHDGK
jgi:formylglycine-generating enzyme required for sulfatase activity